GPIRTMDQMVGHLQHFRGPELCAALEEQGCSIQRVRYWGFPFHTLYKKSISALSPERVYTAFSVGERSDLPKPPFSNALQLLYFARCLFSSGYQLFVHARPPAARWE